MNNTETQTPTATPIRSTTAQRVHLSVETNSMGQLVPLCKGLAPHMAYSAEWLVRMDGHGPTEPSCKTCMKAYAAL